MVPGSENSLGFLCDLMGFVISLFLNILLQFKIVRHFNVCPLGGGRGDGDCLCMNVARNVEVPMSFLLPAKIAAV